ncbi:BTAD domain-containing putative transcriptional regulator [Natronoglycomyces albus]|uniref:Winged helix-turn-helix domain-containing protein n=1 Tax=Natronoglycomyces albus TaxID=2811108 RepID=A0A895XNH8_9ACTN|nr:BTAD domain-containing putative transcriptional regulator [Natronoglycomyces albus]QSB04046.1 winged helix-turn-helix domain-containing protein [Natronoglycomyces albus]
MKFGALGPITVWDDQGRELTVPGVKVRALLAMLLIHRGQVVSVDKLVDALWGHAAPGDAAAVLRTKVTHLRRVIDQAGGNGRSTVLWRSPGYVLDVAAQAVDFEEFAAIIASARKEQYARGTVEYLSWGLSNWRGEAFGEFRDELFAKAMVAQLEEQRIEAIEERAEARLELGDPAWLTSELAEVTEHYPLRERLHAVWMRALYQQGRQNEALEVYAKLAHRLREDMGLDPSPNLAALQQSILRQEEPAAPTESTAVPPRRNASRVPTPLTDIIGRDEDIRQARKSLRENRLVTIAGPGGVGKTRLAIEIGNESAEEYPDGIWFVDLAPIPAPSGGPDADTRAQHSIHDAIARAIGLRDDYAASKHSFENPSHRDRQPDTDTQLACTPDQPELAGRISSFLMITRSLLIVDNAEHLLEATANVIRQLLSSTADVRVLVTSREPFRSPYEQLLTLPPLDVPGAQAHLDPTDLHRFAAVNLFLARAQSAGVRIDPTQENLARVSTVCRRLDGLPLAVELAAAKVRALGLEHLVERLDDRFRLLATASSGADPRHQTLRSVIDWSWDMLSETERMLLRRISVSAGGYLLEAAENVAGFGELNPTDIVETLSRLVEQSLLFAYETPHGMRYRMLESIAAYALERLGASGEYHTVTSRHVAYFSSLVTEAEQRLRTHEQCHWLKAMQAESDNLRSALSYATESSDPVAALRVANSSVWFWFMRGRLTEAHWSLAEAIHTAEATTTNDSSVDTLLAEARNWLAALRLRINAGIDQTAETTALLRSCPTDSARLRRSRWFLAFTMVCSEHTSNITVEPGTPVEAALTGTTADDVWGEAASVLGRAGIALTLGREDEGQQLAEEAATLFDRQGDNWGWLQATCFLSCVAESHGDMDTSQKLNQSALEVAEALELTSEYSMLLSKMGLAALVRGEFGDARQWYQRARHLAGDQCDSTVVGIAEAGLRLVDRRRSGGSVIAELEREIRPAVPAPTWEKAAS